MATFTVVMNGNSGMTEQPQKSLFEQLLSKNSVCVLKGFINDWEPTSWDLQTLANNTPNQKVRVKTGKPYFLGNIPKESDCTFEDWDLEDFFQISD